MDCAKTSPASRSHRVLLVGWDGADWKLIQPLVDQGLMPNMARFVEAGLMGNVASLTPMLSPMLWTSIATGKLADQHQILGFAEPDGDSGKTRPVSSTSRRCKAIWNILSDRGLKAGVVNWFASHPAENINGFVVSDRYAAGPPQEGDWQKPLHSLHPVELLDKACSLRVHPARITREQVESFIPRLSEIDVRSDKEVHQLLGLLAHCATVHTAATWLMQEQDWDFCAIYYDTIDRMSHTFMEYHPPKMEHVSNEDFRRYKDVMTGCYRFHDMMLGRLMQLAGDDATIIILSDHGFHCDRLRPAGSSKIREGQPVAWHRPYGVLAFHGPKIKKDDRVYGASLLDIAPTILMLLGQPVAKDMSGKPLTQIIEVKSDELHVEQIESYETGEAVSTVGGADGDDPWLAAQMLDRLAALGYVEDTAPQGVILDRLRNLGQVYASTGREGLAIEQFNKVLAGKADDTSSKVAIASCLLRLDRIEECERVLREVIGEDTDTPFANLYMGMIELRRENVSDAMEFFRRAETLEPNNPAIHNQIGIIHLRQRRWRNAKRSFERALKIDPDNAEAHDSLGVVYRHQGKAALAVREHMQSIALLHYRPQTHVHLGLALAEVGRIPWAIRAFNVALEMNPDNLVAHRALAALYERVKKDPARAREHRNQAHRLAPETG